MRLLPNGAAAIMQRASTGEFFAEAALCVNNYTCDAVATRDAIVQCIPKLVLIEHLQMKDGFSLKFSMLLAKNTRLQCSRVERLRINRARDRVLHYLICESGNDNIVRVQSSLANLAD